MRYVFLMMAVAMVMSGCKGMSDPMPDFDVPDEDPHSPDNSVPELDAEVDAELDAGLGCNEAQLVYEDRAPRPVDVGCDCFGSKIPPMELPCQNPTVDDCEVSGGDLAVIDVPGGRCRHECDVDGDGQAEWQVTYDRFRVYWWSGGVDLNDDARTEGICEYGWSIWISEGEGSEVYAPSVTGGGRGCICWADDPNRCPVGCAPPTRPLCEAAESACEGHDIGDVCGISENGSTNCEGDGCILGTCERNPSLNHREACCI